MKDNQASSTALLIAKSLTFASSNKTYLPFLSTEIQDLTRAFLHGATSALTVGCYAFFGKIPLARWLVDQIQRVSVPGMIGHYILRKKRIEEIVHEIHGSFGGLEQLVILGGGLDTLGYRVARRYPNMQVIEIDHPATSKAKARAFTEGHVETLINFHLLPVDLGIKDLYGALKSSDLFSFSRATVFVAEGVFMYLDLEDVAKTLQVLKSITHPNRSFVFTYMDLNPHTGRPGFANQSHWVHHWLRTKQEPFLWGASANEIEEFLHQQTLEIRGHADAADLRQRYFQQQDIKAFDTARGENLVWVRPKPGD